jgi:hypothetical protein
VSTIPPVVPWVLVVDMRRPYREVGPTVYLGHYDRGWERDARGLKRDGNGYVAKDPYEVKLTPADPRAAPSPTRCRLWAVTWRSMSGVGSRPSRVEVGSRLHGL